MTNKKKESIPKKAGQEGDKVETVENSINFLNYLKAQVTTNSNSLKEYTLSHRMFVDYLQRHNKTSKQVTQNEVNGFMVELKERYKNNSLIPRIGGLRHYLRYLGFNPSSKGGNIQAEMPTAKATRKEEILTMDEVKQLFIATKDNPLANAVIKTFYYTALRRMELINLNIEDIDFENKMITIQDGKGESGQPQKIAISDIALESIQRYREVRPTPREGHDKALFIGTTDTRISRTAILYLLREARFKAGIKRNVYPHILRASQITHRHNMGADVIHIQELSRHKSLKSLEIYIRSSDKEKRENYDRYTPKLAETDEEPIEPKPIPTPPKKPDVMVANTQPESIESSRKTELLNLLQDGLITPQQYRECLTKQDTVMFG